MADTVRIELAVEAVDNTGKVIDKIVDSLQKLKETADKSHGPLDKASEKVTKFGEQAGKTQKTLQSWLKQKWQIALEAKDKITPLLSTLKNGLSTVAGKAWSVTLKAIDLVTSPVKSILNLLKNPILQAGAVLGVTIGLTDTINTYKDFEATMSKVKAISGATTSEMERLTAKAKEMGETTKFTATEAGDAFTYMAMAGWDSQQMLNGIEGIMNLAAADGLDLATTSDIVTDALTAFHLKASDAAHFADVLAKASSSANTNVAMLGSSFKYVGSVAGGFGYSIEDVAIALAAMANAGVKGDMGGTALRGALTSLISPSENAAKVMDKYGLSMEGTNGKTKTLMEVIEMLRGKFNGLNVSLFDGEGELKDYETILQEMSGASGDTSASVETLSDLATLFSARALPGMLALIQSGTEDFYALSDAIYHADGTASDMSETMLDNLAGSLTILQSAAEGAKLSVGERLAPYIRRFAEWLTGMMPAIKRGLNEAIDWIEGKIEELKRKIQDVTGSVEFQDADFFGKVEILWDEIIATPFHEWWESKGRRMFADTAGNAAKWIGEGIKNGLLALLGVQLDAKSEEQAAKDAGISIAASFMNGLKEGLNSGGGIGSALSSIFGNMLSSAGKILPGGAAPGLDTLVSMIALSKIAAPVLAAGKGVSALGKAVTTPTGGDGASLASWAGTGLAGLLGRTSTTLSARPTYEQIRQSGGALTYKDRLTTTVNGTGLLGGLEKVGIALGSKSTGMGAAAVGGASVLGGLAALGTTISGLNDVYSAINSKERDERAAKGFSGGMKLGGVGAGAFIGSMILPGAGTLIGAGIGGAIGYVSGNSVKKHYEEQAQAAQEAAAKEAAAHELITAKAAYTGQSIQEITFKSRELNKAFEDTETSADTFYTMFREAVNEKIAGSFGDISFSLQEIRDMAKSIVFDSGIAGVEKFQESVAKTEKRLSALKADTSALEKLNWQAGVGIQFTEADVSNYREQTDAFVKDAQNYLRDKHYEATIAFKLLTDGNGDLSGVDSVYASLQEELDSKSSELQAKVKIALDDGVIQLDELEEITNLQNQISDIMNRVSAAEESAKLDTLKIKYGGADMDVESFRQLQSDIAEFMQSAEDTDYEAYTIALTNLKLQFPDGGEAYEAAVAELNANLNRRREERLNRTLTIELQTIVENNDLNLDSVWPDLSGDVSAMASRLRELMNSALAVQPDPIQWTEGQVSQWFGLSGLDAVSLSAFTEMIRGVAETLPQTVREQISAANIGGEVAEAATEMIASANEAIATTEGVDMSGALDSIPENAAETARNLDTSPVSEAISDKMTDSINVGMENLGDAEIELSALKDAAETGVNETLGDINVQAGADAMTANAGTAITDSMSALDMSGANEALTTIVGSGFTDAMSGVNFVEGISVLTTNMTSSVTEGMSGLDFSAASEAIRIILSAAIAAGIRGTDLSAAFAALTALRQRVEAQAKATLGAQIAVQVPVNLTYDYNVTNPTPPKPTVTAQTYTSNVAAHANGGFVRGAELSWVGEDGPEAIIPLGAKRRGRGLELYKQVGEILGVAKNAEGGVYGVADNSAHAHYDNHYGNRYDNRSVSTVTGGSALSNYDNRSASEITNQFAGASVAYLAPDGLHIVQYPSAGTNAPRDVHDTRTTDTDISPSTLTAYDIQSNPLSVFNGGDSLARSFLNGPTSIYDARTEADSFTDMSRTGEASYYNTDSLFRLPEEATAYSALEAHETPFESGTGFYPGDAENGDSGAETAFAPIYDAPADGGGTSGATSRNAPVTINVTLTPSFSFSNTGGESDEKMESFIRRCMKESADDLADELAERLIAVFENTPRR